MSNQLPFLRRHLPCTLTVEVLQSPGPGILRVDYRLVLPSFGFDLTTQALLSAEVVNASPDRENLLLSIGRDAMSQSLRILMNHAASPFIPAPPSSSQERQAAPGPDLASHGSFSTADKEILRGFRISPD